MPRPPKQKVRLTENGLVRSLLSYLEKNDKQVNSTKELAEKFNECEMNDSTYSAGAYRKGDKDGSISMDLAMHAFTPVARDEGPHSDKFRAVVGKIILDPRDASELCERMTKKLDTYAELAKKRSEGIGSLPGSNKYLDSGKVVEPPLLVYKFQSTDDETVDQLFTVLEERPVDPLVFVAIDSGIPKSVEPKLVEPIENIKRALEDELFKGCPPKADHAVRADSFIKRVKQRERLKEIIKRSRNAIRSESMDLLCVAEYSSTATISKSTDGAAQWGSEVEVIETQFLSIILKVVKESDTSAQTLTRESLDYISLEERGMTAAAKDLAEGRIIEAFAKIFKDDSTSNSER